MTMTCSDRQTHRQTVSRTMTCSRNANVQTVCMTMTCSDRQTDGQTVSVTVTCS